MLVNPFPNETSKSGVSPDIPGSAIGKILKQYPSYPAPNRALQASAFIRAKAKTEFTQLDLGFM